MHMIVHVYSSIPLVFHSSFFHVWNIGDYTGAVQEADSTAPVPSFSLFQGVPESSNTSCNR